MSATLLGYTSVRTLAADLIRRLGLHAHRDPDCSIDCTRPSQVIFRWARDGRRLELVLTLHKVLVAWRAAGGCEFVHPLRFETLPGLAASARVWVDRLGEAYDPFDHFTFDVSDLDVADDGEGGGP
jgi:hypothetical protein